MSSAAVSTRKSKRSRTEDALAVIRPSGTTTNSSSSTSCNTCPILQSELEAALADLEHETTLRSIEQRRHSQTETRLRRQLTLANEEADEARAALEDLRVTSDADVNKAREARRVALARLARAEEAAERYRQRGAGEDVERSELAGDVRLLRERVASLEEERDGLRAQLEEEIEANRARAEAAEAAAASENTPKRARRDDADAADSKKTALSPAPPAVMSELNRIRIKLAEAERTNRQLTRKLTAVQSVADSAVRHKEEARSASSRLERVEGELTELRREREERRAVESRWADFRKDIVKAFGGDGEDGIDSSDDEAAAAAAATGASSGRVDTPPEVSLIVGKVQKLQEEVQTARKHLTKARSDLELQRQMATAAERRSEGAAASESTLKKKLIEAESRADGADLELRKLRAQQDVWKREADSLRSLLETYEQSEVRPPTPHKAGAKGGTDALAANDDEGPTVQGLRTSLNSAQERIRLLTEETTTLKAETSSAKTESEAAQTELARVKDKFGKLRDALFKEREKAEKAEERACQAETMAGKGSFDSESTRVLHLKENPFMDAVRSKYEAEIDALRKALEEKREESMSGKLSGSAAKTPLPGRTPPSAGLSSSDQSALDAQKLHRRLKESFREQIGKFREGVYLLTGFKIDMMADSTPLRFKVRSLYAEREEDHLIFAWPNVKKGEAVTSLDLLDTPQAQLLAQDQSFEYMTKFKSLPAFLASVQLGLFEKQTFAG